MNRWIIGLAVVIAIALGWRWYAAKQAPDTMAVWEPHTVELGRLKEAIPCDGSLEPKSKTEIKSRASGEIISLHVEEGEFIEAGTVLAQLDTLKLFQELRQAEANLQSSRAQLRLAERGYSPSDRVNREQQVEDARLSRDQAQREYDRVKGLFDQGFASESEIEDARTKLDLANGDLEVATKLLRTLNEGGEKEDREVARASVIRNTAIVETAREELENATILAPVTGTVLSLPVEVGNTVASGISSNSGGTVIATIGNMSTLLLEGTVDESDIGRVTPGLACEITTDAYPNLLFTGKVVSIAPQATVEQNVSTFKVDIEVDIDNPSVQRGGGRSQFKGTFAGMGGGGGRNPARAMARGMSGGGRPGGGGGGRSAGGGTNGAANPNIPSDSPAPAETPKPTLRAGMTATAEIILTSYDEAPVVPLKFVMFGEDQKAYVLKWPEGTPLPEQPGEDGETPPATKDAGPQPEKVFVEIGYTDGISYAIKSGVKPGDVLVAEAEVEMETTWGAFGMKTKPKKK